MRFSRRAFVGGSLALPLATQLSAAMPGRREFDIAGPGARAITISEWKPRGRERGLVLFSHGAASSPQLYERILDQWALEGWHILAPLHVDSERHPHTRDYPGLASWKARIEDMRALSAHVGNRPWVAAGHSYGGLVALTMGGAAAVPPQGISGPLSDPNAKAVVAFSPPAPVPVLCTAEGYAKLSVPALIQTGTADNPSLGPALPPVPGSWKGHLTPYDVAASGGDRYGLVLEGVDHYFGGLICRYEVPGPQQMARLEDAKRISSQFLRAFGAGDKTARKALDRQVNDALPVRLLRK
jgi:pimeloyl-ACP methyl ester carboxylesterase